MGLCVSVLSIACVKTVVKQKDAGSNPEAGGIFLKVFNAIICYFFVLIYFFFILNATNDFKKTYRSVGAKILLRLKQKHLHRLSY